MSEELETGTENRPKGLHAESKPYCELKCPQLFRDLKKGHRGLQQSDKSLLPDSTKSGQEADQDSLQNPYFSPKEEQ